MFDLPDLVGVFDVHDEVADVVRRFHQVGERVALPCLATVATRRDAKRLVDGGEVFEVVLIDAVLFVGVFVGGGGVFARRRQGRGGQTQAAVVVRAFEAVGDAKALRVAFDVVQVSALRVVVEAFEDVARFRAFEVVAHRLFAEVAEGRVADVVREAGGGNDVADVGGVDVVPRQFGIFFQQPGADAAAEAAPDAGDFKRVGKTGADVVVFFQREDLGFVFHAAEGSGEDEAVAVALEVGTHRGFGAGGLADAVGGEQLRPVHVGCPWGKRRF